MTDEGRLRDQAARGAAASRLRDDDLLSRFFAEMKADCIRNWQNTAIDDTAAREDAWRMHKAVDLLEQKIRATIANGAAALKELQRRQDEKERKP